MSRCTLFELVILRSGRSVFWRFSKRIKELRIKCLKSFIFQIQYGGKIFPVRDSRFDACLVSNTPPNARPRLGLAQFVLSLHAVVAFR